VRDLEKGRAFYDAVLQALGCEKVYDRADALGYGARARPDSPMNSYLTVYRSASASHDDRRHWCFKAQSRAQVEAFYAAALASGGTPDGAPGLRPNYHPSYFAAFVRDPDGNRIEAVCHLEE
jgi:catechol 2,3-dioxygenase-like lactoylglutathione lyase family enzyme